MSRTDWIFVAIVLAVGLLAALFLTFAATADSTPACGGSPLAARCGGLQ